MSRLDLPRVLMRGSAGVLALVWLLAAAMGLWRTQADAQEEMQSAMALAATLQRLATSAPLDDQALLDALREPAWPSSASAAPAADGAASAEPAPLRHLRLTLRDAEGRLLLGGRADAPASPPVEWLVSLQRRLSGDRDPPPLAWLLPRPQGGAWTAVLSPTPDSERREAIEGLLLNLALLAAGACGVLALLRWQLQRALRPLQALVARIDPERGGSLPTRSPAQSPAHSAARHRSDESTRPPDREPPPMPPTLIRELQLIADALERADAQRRVLGQRLQSLQEDERRRLAQELHDELGQRLTALRMDATVLHRRVQADPAAAALARDLSTQVEAAQHEVRDLLARLAPRSDATQPAERLRDMLLPLAAAQRGLQVELDCDLGDAPLPEALLQAVYRLSQEGLTNVVRHAGATRAWLSVGRGADGDVHWSLRDDGRGLGVGVVQGGGAEPSTDQASALPALSASNDWQASETSTTPDTGAAPATLSTLSARGSGLAGMRERVWAYGGDLLIADARPGLALSATLKPPPESPGT